MNGWASPATIVGAWSAVAGTAAAVIGWRVFAWQRQSDVPVVTCDFDLHTKIEGWLVLELHVNNVTATRWKLHTLTFRPRSAARGISEDDGYQQDKHGGSSFAPEAAALSASSIIALHRSFNPAGTERTMWQPGSSGIERVYLFRPSIRSSKLSMRLSLVSKDAVQRKIVIAIRRDAPPPVSAAAA